MVRKLFTIFPSIFQAFRMFPGFTLNSRLRPPHILDTRRLSLRLQKVKGFVMKFGRALRACCLAFGIALTLCGNAPVRAADDSFSRIEDVVYGRKHGVALTMDVFTPKANANGVG